MTAQDYGKDEDSSEALLKKHEALLSDLEAFGNTIKSLREQANACRVSIKTMNDVINIHQFLRALIGHTSPTRPYLHTFSSLLVRVLLLLMMMPIILMFEVLMCK